MKSSEIIEAILNEVNQNQTSFQKKIGVSSATFSEIKSGRIKNISRTVANKIVAVYPQFSVKWIMTGEGEMYAEGVREPSAVSCPGADNLSSALQTINALVSQMAEKDRQVAQLLDMLDRSQRGAASGAASGADAVG